MTLQTLQFQPGIVRDVTARAAKGTWYDGNLVRFRMGFPESMGGWLNYALINSSVVGICRALHVWHTLGNRRYVGLGTTTRYYAEFGSGLYDITPIVRIATLANPFAASAGSTTLTVTDAAHDVIVGTAVTFSGATSLGGVITAAVLNQEHIVTAVPSSTTYEITLPLAANASDTGNGGGAVTAEYQVNPGLNNQVGGPGWNAGGWGEDGWGEPSPFDVNVEIRLWSHDNYGEDLVYGVRNGGVFYWDNSSGLTARGTRLADRVGADAQTPTIATQVLVSERDRHVIALGANMGGTTAQDPLLIRFSDQEDPLTWIPTATNTAGDLRLSSGGQIIRALKTKREILIWTDVSLHSMRFIGPPFTFGVEQIGERTSLMGYNSMAQAEDIVYWMGKGAFYAYSGQVQELPCSVKEYVFTDINTSQSDKVFAGTNLGFSEIIWFYPSSNSIENDCYVIYNYRDNAWYFGKLARTAWLDNVEASKPIGAGTDSKLYIHEQGLDDSSQTPPAPLNSYIESAPIDLQDGNQFMFIRRILPDITFYDSTDTPQATLTLTAQNFSGSALGDTATAPTARSAVVPVEQFTEQVHVRLRGRSVRLKVESNKVGTRWQLGAPRIDVRPDGRR